MIRYIDLFAGIGGIRLGVEQALSELGIEGECLYSCEIDRDACATYKLNFDNDPFGDVREINSLPDFDLLLAGFPCQPFSYAGKRKGFGDTRGTLFFEIEKILISHKPKMFLLENVRGLMSHDGGKTIETILSKLHGLDYQTKILILNSSEFGVPQNRIRLYILGLLGETPNTTLISSLGAKDTHSFSRTNRQLFLFNDDKLIKQKTVGEILDDTVPEKYLCSDVFSSALRRVIGADITKLNGYRMIDYRGGKSIHSWEVGTKGLCTENEISFMNELIQNRRKHIFGTHQDGKKLTLQQIKTFYRDDDIDEVIPSLIRKGYLSEADGKYNPVCGNMSFEVFKFLDPSSVSITLTSSDANRLGIVHNGVIRRITPRECARLQGFPDTFIINPDDQAAYKQFGNSVSMPVVKEVMFDFLTKNYLQKKVS